MIAKFHLVALFICGSLFFSVGNDLREPLARHRVDGDGLAASVGIVLQRTKHVFCLVASLVKPVAGGLSSGEQAARLPF